MHQLNAFAFGIPHDINGFHPYTMSSISLLHTLVESPLHKCFHLIEIIDFVLISRREEEIVSLDTFPTSNDEINQNQDSRRVRKFWLNSLLCLLVVATATDSSACLEFISKFFLSICENICAVGTWPYSLQLRG